MPTASSLRRRPRTTPDQWAKWVLERRFGGDPGNRAQSDRFQHRIRAKVMAMAAVAAGDSVLDIGSRDGYLGLGALELVGAGGSVTFTSDAPALLDACRTAAQASGLPGDTRFLAMAPDDLTEIPDASFDIVTMRSVLNYVPDRVAALRDYHRVLRPGGTLAFVQMYPSPELSGQVWGYDVSAVEPLASRIREVLRAYEPETYRRFDENQVLDWLAEAGFRKVDLHHEVEIADTSDWPPPDWERTRNLAAGPDQPTIQEAIDEALSPAEADEFIAWLRPEVESGRRHVRFPKSFVRAVRSPAASHR